MTLEIVQFQKRQEKWKPVRLGYAKKNDKGQLNLYFDAMPLPQVRDGEISCSVVVQERQQRDDSQQGNASQGGAPADLDGDSIPF